MNPDEYRVISFDQGPRLDAGKEIRGQKILDAAKRPGDPSSQTTISVVGSEYKAVAKSGGVCEALALKWLKVKFKENSDAQEWAGWSRQKAGPRVALIDRDKTFDRAFSRYAAADADQRFGLESYYGLTGLGQILPQGDGPVGVTSYVARTVAHSKHGYYLHSIVCPKFSNGLHALAYYTSSGKLLNLSSHVYMFDPDFGEYKVPNGKFGTWMPKFVQFFYGAGEGDSNWLKAMSLGTKRATPE